MIKIAKIAFAVMILGIALFTLGRLFGGQLYSVYYDGRLHSTKEAANDFVEIYDEQFGHYYYKG